MSKDWNIISRTILPYIYQDDVIGTSSQSGLGDTTQSLFLSPKDPGPGGLIWGAGPLAAAIVVMSLLLIWRHAANIQKLLAGTESKLGQKAHGATAASDTKAKGAK